jgi:hypothetical protein
VEKEADRSTQGQQQAQDTLSTRHVVQGRQRGDGKQGEGQVSSAHDRVVAVVAQWHLP